MKTSLDESFEKAMVAAAKERPVISHKRKKKLGGIKGQGRVRFKGPQEHNRYTALQKDRHGDFYADEDEETNTFCVFGSESGFCYSTHFTMEEAEKAAKKMTTKRLPSAS
jgi:hypothetical protein